MSGENTVNVEKLKPWKILLEVFYQFEIVGDDPLKIFDEIYRREKLKKDLYENLKDSIIKIKNSLNVIDKMIEENVLNWDKERILKVDLSLLRIGIGAFLFSPEDPKRVINYILEVSKLYSSEESYKFLNGVLDKVAKKLGKL